jgi:hypothetical protein
MVLSALVVQVAPTGTRRIITGDNLAPAWLVKLRSYRCISDTRGRCHEPVELMCRTPQTEALMDVEPFVDARLDTEAARPLLILLGVRNTPTGPKQIIERLLALAKASKPPLHELSKWYQRLDSLFENCSTEDQQGIKSIFRKEKLILAEDGTWHTSETAYITANDDDVPGAPLIVISANQLALWHKIGVNERPTAELAIQWLQGLPSGEKVPTNDVRRIKSLLGRHPTRIWNECGHWLNLSGEWTSITDLKFMLTMQLLIPWGKLHDWVKSETADLQMLSLEINREPPFSQLLPLAGQIEKRLEKQVGQGRSLSLEWLQTLGQVLKRIRLSDDLQTKRIREQARCLATTRGIQLESITTVAYLNGKPAGLPESESLTWLDQTLYATKLSKAKLASQISKQISVKFDWAEMEALLTFCFERDEMAIRAYLEENFPLEPEEAILPAMDVEIDDTDPSPEPGREIPIVTLPEPADLPNEEVIPDLPDEDPVPPNLRPPISTTRVPQVSLMERFALAQGFRKVDNQQFIHSDGTTIMKAEGVFPWVVRSSNGGGSLYYWTREHCLEMKPLDLPTEVWHLIEKDPEHHALILQDQQASPLQFTGHGLLVSKQSGQLRLYPASYRISLEKNP